MGGVAEPPVPATIVLTPTQAGTTADQELERHLRFERDCRLAWQALLLTVFKGSSHSSWHAGTVVGAGPAGGARRPER